MFRVQGLGFRVPGFRAWGLQGAEVEKLLRPLSDHLRLLRDTAIPNGASHRIV